jgi:O-antigen/teichoic acid export membrane protein
VSNGANVIVTVLIARLLSEQDYSVVVRLVSIFLVLAIPGSALLVAVVRRVTAWEHNGQHHLVDPWMKRVRKAGFTALAIFAVFAFASRWWLGDVLGLGTPTGIAEILIAGAGWAMLACDRGLLQSRRDYDGLARSLLTEGAARTVITLALIKFIGIEGAALGLLCALIAGDLEARRSLAVGKVRPLEDEQEAIAAAAPAAAVVPIAGRRQLLTDVVGALAVLGLLAVLQNLDVLIVGEQSNEAVKQYAPISVACKSLVFAALVLSGYLLPEAAARSHKGEHAFRQLAIALALLAVPAGLLILISAAAPATVLKLVFGPKLTKGAPAFATLAVAMTLLAATVLFTHYLLGHGRKLIIAILGITVVAYAVALESVHGELVPTARVAAGCMFVLAVASAGLIAIAAGTRISTRH